LEVRLDRPLASDVLHISGRAPLGSPPIVRYAAVPDAPRFFLQAFRLALAAEGIEVRGHIRLGRPDASTLIVEPPVRVVHHSAPLADVAVRFMKVSQNLYGEALLHALAPDPAASLASRRVVVHEALASLGVVPADLQVSDGSGLSRRNFVTSRTLVALLQAMSSSAHRESFKRTLPIAGVDGTLERRLTGTACTGRVRAKTGTLSHVRSLSGYVETRSGREIVFSVLANNHLQPASDIDGHVDRALLLLCK
jgi:D-alanyl-D-alanine carboxypeptidase/D-alanyl-D-alanine-endopeptidase (penicillin-binding protein 4)